MTTRARTATRTLSVLRTLVGTGSWASPGASWQAFALGSIDREPRAALITRLFAVRELTLALAVQHPDRAVRRAALQAGVAIDTVDVVATLIGLRRGAPRATLLTFAGGAAFFALLGVLGLGEDLDLPDSPT